MNEHTLHAVTANYETVSYFYTRDKEHTNKKPCHRVYIIDSEVSRVYEIVLECYDFQIKNKVRGLIENPKIVGGK